MGTHHTLKNLSEKDEGKVRSDKHLFPEMPETLHENDLHPSDRMIFILATMAWSSLVGRYQLAS